MDSYEFDSVRAEKAEAMVKCQRQIKLHKLRYVLEICVIVVSIPWLSNWIPSAVKISGDYVREIVVGFFHRTFYVFLLTNLMVFALIISYYMKSDNEESKADIHDEFVKASESYRRLAVTKEPAVSEVLDEYYVDKEIVYLKKAVATDNSVTDSSVAETVRESTAADSPVQCTSDESTAEKNPCKITKPEREFRRSRTELCWKMVTEKPERELRRSETEKCRKITRSVEDMSGEEFRDRIEKFIAMQKRIQLEEHRREARIFTQKTQPCMAIALKSH